MISEKFTDKEKEMIANQIKPIYIETVNIEMKKLINIGKDAHTMSSRSRIGNNVVDYFTFVQRLKTKGKYNINFFEFIVNIDEFKKKKNLFKICYIIMIQLKIKIKLKMNISL